MTSLQVAYPRIKGISWFQWNKEDGNHLLQRVPEQAQMYAAAVASPRYIDDAGQVVALTPASGAPRTVTVPREIVLKEPVPLAVPRQETVRTETVRTEAPATVPPRAPIKLQILPRGR
jgi:hypothetical protein